MRVVVDSNLLISSLMGKELNKLLDLIEKNEIELITSYEQVGEIIDVLERPKVDKYIKNKSKKKLLLRFLKRKTEIVSIKNTIDDCRDKKDNFILEMGIAGKAKYIVTGDKDLLELKTFRKINIIKYNKFKEKILNKI